MRKLGLVIGIVTVGILCAIGVKGYAETSKVIVYTAFTKSITDTSGDGTKENPYNRFEDALENVADGGTIYIIAGEKGFINDPTEDMPFVINKSVTIQPEPGSNGAVLSSRAPGIVLGADVTFENITLGFANGYHDQIFVNGHTLTMQNVSRETGSRLVDLVGGTVCDSTGNPLVEEQGNNSKIIVKGSSTCIGNIYAGSINGTWNSSVSIQVTDIPNGQIGEIYGSGANEATYDRDDWFSMEEPPAPVADGVTYPVNGQVTISMENASLSLVEGTGASEGTKLYCKTKYLNNYTKMQNINYLQIDSGQFTPPVLTTKGDNVGISVSSEGIIDFSAIGNFSVENFIGGGKVVVGLDNCFTITKNATGTSMFEAEG